MGRRTPDLWELQQKFLEHLKVTGYSPQTRKTYASNTKAFIKWAERQELTALSRITTSKLREYAVELALRPSQRQVKGDPRRGLSLRTRSHHIAALKNFFNYLRKTGHVLTSPASELESPRIRRKLPSDILTVGEMMQVLAIIDDSHPRGMRDRAALELLYAAGLRRRELLGLRLGHINLKQNLMQFIGKGGKARVLPLTEQARLCLERYLRLGRPKMGKNKRDHLFVSPRRGPMRGKDLTRALEGYVEAAGIQKRVTLHTIRHTMATHMLMGEADIRYIKEILGHESLKTTQLYTHLDTRDLAAVLKRAHPREQGFQ